MKLSTFKRYALGLLYLLFSISANSQNETHTEFINRANFVFGSLEKNRVPHGSLFDYAMKFADLKITMVKIKPFVNTQQPNINEIPLFSNYQTTRSRNELLTHLHSSLLLLFFASHIAKKKKPKPRWNNYRLKHKPVPILLVAW